MTPSKKLKGSALLEYLLTVSRRMAEIRNLDNLLTYAIDKIMQLVGAERGYIVLVNDKGDTYFRVKRKIQTPETKLSGETKLLSIPISQGEPTSRSILMHVIENRQYLVVEDAMVDPRFHDSTSVIQMRLRSVMCVPLISQNQIIGAIYVENRTDMGRFSQNDIKPLEFFSNQAAVAIKNANLYTNLEDRTVELKNAMVSLGESETRFRAIFESSTDAIAVSQDSILYLVNPAFLKMFGYNHPDEVLGKSITEFVSPSEKENIAEILHKRSVGEETATSYEAVGIREDGSEFFFEIHISIMELSDEESYSIGVLRDITQRKQDHTQILRQLRYLKSLNNIDKAITSSTDLSSTLDTLLEHVVSGLEVDAATVLLFNPTTMILSFGTGYGFHNSSSLQNTRLHLGESLAGRAALEKNIVNVPDLTESADNFLDSPRLEKEGIIAYYGVPLVARGQIVGVLEIFHRSPLDPDREWLSFLNALAIQTAIAIDNATLFVGMQRSNTELSLAYDNTLEGWAKALELRDYETEGHSRRVTKLTMKLAENVGVSDEQLLNIRRGALLHDVGKMSVPDTILLKPSALTDEEWTIVRQHPEHGYEMLAPISFLKPALDIPRYHHERWDGSGYPYGLAGKEIPLAARIFAIVDVWDALLSERPYKKAWSDQDALVYIQEQSGKSFDPKIVKIFLEIIKEIYN
ncbi:MAG: GAF domain-containing protein [Chloroflexi bacterium]|nr:GAF domain-containing protein [Chloroflexota bacterium]